jgi:hypothetical protein
MFGTYSPRTSKLEQDEPVDGCSMSQSACPEEGANAQNDVEQPENAHGGIAGQSDAEANGGSLAYPSASAGYREDCAENGASRQLGAPKVAWKRRLAPRNEFTALSQKAGSFITGAGEACQFVPLVKGVDYSFDERADACEMAPINARIVLQVPRLS